MKWLETLTLLYHASIQEEPQGKPLLIFVNSTAKTTLNHYCYVCF